MSQMLTGIGTRKCFLIYRVYPSFTDQEVREHAMTVAGGIYGDDAEKNLLGIYRADEDNQVAAERNFMKLRPVPADGLDFLPALAAVDAPELRLELHASMSCNFIWMPFKPSRANTCMRPSNISRWTGS
jgi:hypothetical protein